MHHKFTPSGITAPAKPMAQCINVIGERPVAAKPTSLGGFPTHGASSANFAGVERRLLVLAPERMSGYA